MKITAVHTAVVEGNYDWALRPDRHGLGWAVGAGGVLHGARPDRDRARSRAAARRRGSPRCRPAVEQAALGSLGRGLAGRHRLQRDLGHGGRALGSRGAGLRRADPQPPRRSLPRLRAHVRRLPRGRGARVDGRHDGRAPRALGPGAARGGEGRLDPRARARSRLRPRGARRAVHPRALRPARA